MPRDSEAGHRSLAEYLGYCEGVKWRPLQASTARAQGPERLWPCPTFKPFCLVCRRSKATEITIIMLHHVVPINKCVFFPFSFSLCLKKSAVLKTNPKRLWNLAVYVQKPRLMFCYFQLVYTKRIFRSSTYHCCPVITFHSIVRDAVLFFLLGPEWIIQHCMFRSLSHKCWNWLHRAIGAVSHFACLKNHWNSLRHLQCPWNSGF